MPREGISGKVLELMPWEEKKTRAAWDMVEKAWDPGTQEAEGRGWKIQGPLGQHSEM